MGETMTARAALVGLGFVLASVSLGDDLPPGCFNWNIKITKPTQKPPPLKQGQINYVRGSRSDEVEYAGARAVVNNSVSSVYEWLLDHRNWKDMTKTKLQVKTEKKPGYEDFHTVDVDLHVFAFISVSWVEEWGYALLQGTPKDPIEILISYQKKSGTSHLEHLCGNVSLHKVGRERTDVYLYEEAKADRYENERILAMHESTLKILNRGKAIPLLKSKKKEE